MDTRASLAHLPAPPCSAECQCGYEPETLQHLWWHCPTWDPIREVFACQIIAANLDAMSTPMKELGFQTATQQGSVAWIQEMMVRIFEQRFKEFGFTLDASQVMHPGLTKKK